LPLRTIPKVSLHLLEQGNIDGLAVRLYRFSLNHCISLQLSTYGASVPAKQSGDFIGTGSLLFHPLDGFALRLLNVAILVDSCVILSLAHGCDLHGFVQQNNLTVFAYYEPFLLTHLCCTWGFNPGFNFIFTLS